MAVYIAHYYPAEDFDRFFRIGSCVDIIGPTFASYAEAAAQIGEELTDIVIQNLPVAPYIIKATLTENGYKVLETYDVDDAGGRSSNGYRAANGRAAGASMTKPSAVFTPFGTFKAAEGKKGKFQVSAKPLVGLSIDESAEEKLYSPDDIASKYGAFMARYAPGVGSKDAKTRIPLNKLERAFRDTYLPEEEKKKRAEANAKAQERRKQAEQKITEGVQTKVQAAGGNIDKAIGIAEKQVETIEKAVEEGKITSKEATPIIAAQMKEKEILEVLKEFCPQHDEEALLRSVKKIVAMSFGGTPEAQEAAEVVVENIKNDLESGVTEASEVETPAETPAETAAETLTKPRRGRPKSEDSVKQQATDALLPPRKRGRPKKERSAEELAILEKKQRDLAERREKGMPVRGRRPKTITTEEIPPVVAEHITPDPTPSEERGGVEVAKELLEQTKVIETAREEAKAQTTDPTVVVKDAPEVIVSIPEELTEAEKAAEREAERERLRLESEREEEEDAEAEREAIRKLLNVKVSFNPEEYTPSTVDVSAEIEKLIVTLNGISTRFDDFSDMAPEVAARVPFDSQSLLRELRDARRLQGTQAGEMKVNELRQRLDKAEKTVDDAISDYSQKQKSDKKRAAEIAGGATSKKVKQVEPPPSFDEPAAPPSDLDDLFGEPPATLLGKKLF